MKLELQGVYTIVRRKDTWRRNGRAGAAARRGTREEAARAQGVATGAPDAARTAGHACRRSKEACVAWLLFQCMDVFPLCSSFIRFCNEHHSANFVGLRRIT